MTQVIFIELAVAKKTQYVCDIIEKFYGDTLSVHVFVKDNPDAHRLDQQLWSWKPDTFIPHVRVQTPQADAEEQIQIVSEPSSASNAQALILFDPLPPEVFNNYRFVIDFAETYDARRLQDSRRRFKTLLDEGKRKPEFMKLGAFLSRNLG